MEDKLATDLPENSISQRQIAVRIVSLASVSDRDALQSWATELLSIAQQKTSTLIKAQRAITVTQNFSVLLPIFKVISREVKRRAWDNRSASSRFGLAGAAMGIVAFGGQSAGIAAFGTAVGAAMGCARLRVCFRRCSYRGT